MPGENIHDWSTTAASNANADSSINWAEGQARASVNDSSRSMMAAHAKDRNLRNGSITTAGTANAQTFSSGLSYISSNLPVGLRPLLKIGAGLTNTGTTTLNCDGVGNATVKDQTGADLGAGQLRAGQYAEFRWDGTNWILLNPLPRVWTVALLTATNASWPVPSGTTEMIVEAWGGGASGAGSAAGLNRGAGGGGGGYCYKYYASTMDTTLAVTIGAGGASSATNTNGNGGGATSVVGANLGTLTANGGGGALCANGAAGGTGGAASGGDLNITGGDGWASFPNSQSVYGFGGDAPRGGPGGKNNVGAAGSVPGGGGAGENHIASGSGAGAAGRVMIRTR